MSSEIVSQEMAVRLDAVVGSLMVAAIVKGFRTSEHGQS